MAERDEYGGSNGWSEHGSKGTTLKILVIGDSHVEPDQDLSRFEVLGRFVASRQPDAIISIGDFLSLDSLSAWDRDKRKTMEGKRYWKEIECGNTALDLLDKEVTKFNEKAGRKHTKRYYPERYFINGNHEDRLDRYLDANPTFDGVEISLEYTLKLHERGYKIVEYKHHLVLDDIAFTHIPIANNGRPVGGKYVCNKSLDLYNYSVVFGHTHRLEIANKHRHGGEHLQQAVNCGCFFENIPEYMKGTTTDYWRGVLMLNTYQNMRFDIETISLGRLKREYG